LTLDPLVDDRPRGGDGAGGQGGAAQGVTADLAPGLEQLFDREPEEGSWRLTVDGTLPPGLVGTCYVNGPARFRHGGLRYGNWLDGDGYVGALRFDAAGAQFTGRFVASRKRCDELEAGQPLYRTFGTAFPGDRLLRTGLASPVNVSVYPWGGKLLAFGEQGLPWELDPATLETRGEEDFGRINPLTPFSAHPAVDPRTGDLVNFGVSFAADRPVLHLITLGADGEGRRSRLPLPLPVSLHDFALSPRFAAFYLAPYVLDVRALLDGGATVLDSLAWRPELGTRLLVVERDSGRPVADLPVGERYCLHHVNCHEDGDHLVVDLVELEEPVSPVSQGMPDLFVEVAPAHPVRLVVDVASGRLAERQEIPFTESADFPAHDPRLRGVPCRDSFLLSISATGRPGRKFFDRLVRLDWERLEIAETWTAPAGCYLGGEPTVVPAEGGALVVVQEHAVGERQGSAVRTRFLVFAATAVARGPIAAIPLPSPIPPGFHSCWAAGAPPQQP
jgi:all-trans-8'-apo-beta-carotenal 15,15'-oxygenase